MKKERLILAELCGVMLGDGCFFKGPRCYQISVAFNKQETDYLDYVLGLFKLLRPKEKFSILELKHEFLLRTYSSIVSHLLLEAGIRPGNKTKRSVLIPKWIKEDKKLTIAFLRGLFDTDGCVYRKYDQYLQIQMKLANKDLVEDVRAVISELGFNPTKVILDFEKIHKSYEWKFYLSRQAEIHKFIKEVGFCNPKHLSRYRKLCKSG